MIEEIGIVRQCWRCLQWLSIDQFRELEKLCGDCRRWHPQKHIRATAIRTLTVTEKGQVFLAAERTAVLGG